MGSDERYELDGHFNTALSDTAALRISFNHDQEDGQTESLSTGDGLDGEQNTSIRAQLLLETQRQFQCFAQGGVQRGPGRSARAPRLFPA